MTMAYKGIMGRDTGMPMPMGIKCVAVAAGCSAAGIGRPSAGIGRVISGEIGRSWLESPKILGRRAVIGFVAYVAYSHIGASSYRHNAEQQIAKCELKGNGHPHDGNEAYTRLLHAGGGV